MLVIPAIDLKNGSVVRLYQGKQDQKKVYSSKPGDVAKLWEQEGAKLIHIVDLDGAFQGSPQNLDALKNILDAFNIPVEFGGGVRDKQTIDSLFKLGVKRIVLGTRAANDSKFLQEVFNEYKDRIIVSIDTKQSLVLTQGWVNANEGVDLKGFILHLKDIGLKELIFTDTLKDGTLEGPNIAAISDVLRSGLKVIASGGVSCIEDLIKLQQLEPQGLTGVIVGKALYEGRFTLKEANKIIKKEG